MEVNSALSAEIQKLGQQLSGDINKVKMSTEKVCDEIKTSVQTVTSDAVQAIESSSKDAKEVISKQTIELSSITSVVDQIKTAAKETESYADKLRTSSSMLGITDANPWMTVMNNKHKGEASNSGSVPARRKVIGNKKLDNSISIKISASVSNSSWHIFIGKLAINTTEKDLSDYLENNGVAVQKVSKIKPTQKWHEKSAAFKVSVSTVNKDDVMNADLWPDHVEVRDWFFKPRP